MDIPEVEARQTTRTILRWSAVPIMLNIVHGLQIQGALEGLLTCNVCCSGTVSPYPPRQFKGWSEVST